MNDNEENVTELGIKNKTSSTRIIFDIILFTTKASFKTKFISLSIIITF